jgi:hypothetical protein
MDNFLRFITRKKLLNTKNWGSLCNQQYNKQKQKNTIESAFGFTVLTTLFTLLTP